MNKDIKDNLENYINKHGDMYMKLSTEELDYLEQQFLLPEDNEILSLYEEQERLITEEEYEQTIHNINLHDKLDDILVECDLNDIEVPSEFLDFLQILLLGAGKYEPNNWLKEDGKKSSHKEMHESLFRHVAESSSGSIKDKETGLHPLLHAAARCCMVYTRCKRGIKHTND